MRALSLGLLCAAMLGVMLSPLSLRGRARSWTPFRRALVALVAVSQLAALGVVGAVALTWGAGQQLWLHVGLSAVIGALCALVDVRLYRGIALAGEEAAVYAYARAMEEQVAAQAEHLKGATSTQAQTERMRQTCLTSFERVARALAEGDEAAAEAAVERAAASIPRTGQRLCEHVVADALLKAKIAEAEASGVELDVRAQLPADMRVTDAELCAVIANLVDNAVVAAAAARATGEGGEKGGDKGACTCADKGAGRPVVSVSAGIVQGCLVVRVENPSDRGASRAAERATRRAAKWAPGESAPRHGWGTSIVREIAARRAGSLTISERDGRVCAIAVMMLGS